MPTAPEIVFDFQLESDLPFPDHGQLTAWLLAVAKEEHKQIGWLNYSFVDDEQLHQMNVRYLQHDTRTDILTFPYEYDPIEADIAISLERVAENAKEHQTTLEHETLRVIVHGLLHMCGYEDKTVELRVPMRQREDSCIALFYQQ